METEIDFVVTWVDGSDKAWREDKARYDGTGIIDDSEERYRDWELFKYWFRGVEKNAPWVRKIHFITWGHLPKWLDTSNPKLNIVRHEDYIPKEFLPTFNSNVIELYSHKIKGLSEHFVNFNDDMFIVKPMKPDDFYRNGKPCDMLAFQPVVANPKNPVMSHLFMNNSLVLCKYFNKRENVKSQPGKYFKIGYPPLYFFYNMLEMAFPLYTGFYTVHGPSPFLKSTYEEIWEKEEELLTGMSKNRFRSADDVTQYLFREWQKLTGNFYPRNVQKDSAYYDVSEDNSALRREIQKGKRKVICLNDAPDITGDVEKIKAELLDIFEQCLPEKSSFEK